MAIVTAAHMAFTFGILGNIVSFLVYLAPVPTFHKIYKRKSTEEFQSIPYSVALFSSTLYLYYAFLKKNVIMLITINSVGCAFEVVFLTIFMLYATNKSKIFTTKLLILFNIGTLGLIITCTYFLSEGHKRVKTVGWICSVFSVCVFGAPLSIMAPNVVGFILGISQTILYAIYRKKEQQIILPEIKLHDISNIKDRKSQDRVQNPSKVESIEIIDPDQGQARRGTDLVPSEDRITEDVAETELIV
ncbi:bidirectional sugar transporter NEC1-like [Olea europaea subsp. europaea]|uniref:Bidirectional sugar transporter SWEET n=1 Tax=Olea europaea subsp. europaea TaxID=158383 RepID=A0A8S0QE34_OLEEU|nr:bidirectional sugar transporter NEC1-like [Olea europaea subsp. europaea]